MDRKIYINITNKCNYECPFCCMYSSPKGKRFMSFDTLYKIVSKISNSHGEKLIIQLEGGEPLLHPNLTLILEYLLNKKNVNEVVIDTNGSLLSQKIDKIVDISERYNKKVIIKPSINSYLIKINPTIINDYKNLLSSLEFLNNVKMEFNVRYMNEKDMTSLKEKIGYLISHSNIYQFNKYGKAKSLDLPNLIINNVYKWECYSSDGRCFKTDLLARSEYEYKLIKMQ